MPRRGRTNRLCTGNQVFVDDSSTTTRPTDRVRAQGWGAPCINAGERGGTGTGAEDGDDLRRGRDNPSIRPAMDGMQLGQKTGRQVFLHPEAPRACYV